MMVHSNSIEVYTLPTSYELSQNYPNPFNPSTKIKFTIPASPKSSPKERTFIELKVYDILDNEVATLVDEEKKPDVWEVTFSSHSGQDQNLSSRIYIYQLIVGVPSANSHNGQAGQSFVE